MKRPLKPSEVPPGSVFRQDTTFKPGEYCVPSSVREHGVHLLTEFFGWEDLKNSLWRILRPGESWQPCYVEEQPKLRNISPDELPDEFVLSARNCSGPFMLVNKNKLWDCEFYIKEYIKNGYFWSRSLDGPWNSFQVEDK